MTEVCPIHAARRLSISKLWRVDDDDDEEDDDHDDDDDDDDDDIKSNVWVLTGGVYTSRLKSSPTACHEERCFLAACRKEAQTKYFPFTAYRPLSFE